MLKRRRKEPFGKAGLTVAILALVMAMVGGAFAANHGASASKAGKQGKQGKPGKTGPAGPAGPAGAKGDPGTAGSNGSNGTNGTNGTSVTTAAIATTSATCNHNGGVEVKSASPVQNVCNGTTGFTTTLPSGQTETGVFSSGEILAAEGRDFPAISFTIPLAAPLDAGHVHYASKAIQGAEFGSGPEEACEGKTAGAELEACEAAAEAIQEACPGSVLSPLAEKGHLCLYEGIAVGVEPPGEEVKVLRISPPSSLSLTGAATAGAVVDVFYEGAEEKGQLAGSWAVTAP